MSKPSANFEISEHYGGEAVTKFYPDAHFYAVTDNGYIDPLTGKKAPFKDRRMGGGTSITGVMAKGQGLMLYPMYEMRKYLKNWARLHTFEEILASPLTWDDILKEGTNAHVKKSDRGKSVGTDAHAWVELYLRELLRIQDLKENPTPTNSAEEVKAAQQASKFVCPEIADVEEIATVLRSSYIALFKASKPKTFEDYKKLPRMLLQDAEMREAIWTEATMLRRSITAAKEWMDMHEIYVHGTEDTVYSRKFQICGKYDGDLSVVCSQACNWCYLNGDKMGLKILLDREGPSATFTGRYIEDFKSTNASTDAPKGIYPEYLAQCGTYDIAKTEEFPEIVYDGHLILNGSKNEGTFNTHFSFNRERNCKWAMDLSSVKESIYQAKQEVKASA